MQKSILTVSGDKEFLEEIRSHLEEGGRFRICSVNSGVEALKIAAIDNFDVAILDAEISDIPFVPFTRDLIYAQPNLKLLIYPPNNNPHHPVIKGLVSHGFLNKPFFAPEVGSSLAAMFNPVQETENEPPTDAVEVPNVEEAPIGEIRDELEFSELDISEVENANISLTATSIDQEPVEDFPEDQLRTMTEENLPDSESFENSDDAELDSFPGKNEFRELDAFLDSMPPPDPDETERLFAEGELFAPETTSEETLQIDNGSPEDLGPSIQFTEEVLQGVDSSWLDDSTIEQEIPLPLSETSGEDLVQDQFIDAAYLENETSLDSELRQETAETHGEDFLLDSLNKSQVPPPLPPLPASLLNPVEESVGNNLKPATEVAEPLSISTDESRPGTTPMGVKGIKFEYSCVLIPENPQQFIARDLSDRIGFILPQIHMTSGWRVTSISVRPLYLMWRITLPASICPRDAVIEIRKRTSEYLFSNFPELLMNNNEQDFWAADYVILSGNKNPAISIIQELIHRVRKSQQDLKV